MENLINASNEFGFNIYKVIARRESGSFIVSPFSAETLLVFTCHGCKDQTGKEIETVLHLTENGKTNEERVRNLLPLLKNDKDYTVRIVNTLYVKDDFDVNTKFKEVVTEIYSSGFKKVDFAKSSKAVETLNSSVGKQTDETIQNLINPNDLNYDTRAVLMNSLYFEANFLKPFSEAHLLAFHKSPVNRTLVKGMYITDNFLYHKCKSLNAKFIELPFKGGNSSITMILPKDKNLPRIEKKVDEICRNHNFKKRKVGVVIPEFKIKCEMDFKKIFKELGAVTLSDDFEVDLSGIGGEKGDLMTEKVIQKSVFEINEEGVKSAASSHIDYGFAMAQFSFSSTKQFIANHPFLFYIRVKGVIILIGRVIDPKS